MFNVLLYQTPLYSFNNGSLTDAGARLVASKPHWNFFVPAPYNAGVIGSVIAFPSSYVGAGNSVHFVMLTLQALFSVLFFSVLYSYRSNNINHKTSYSQQV